MSSLCTTLKVLSEFVTLPKVKLHGCMALYSGIGICICGDVIYRGLKYGFYDGFTDQIAEKLSKYKLKLFRRTINHMR